MQFENLNREVEWIIKDGTYHHMDEFILRMFALNNNEALTHVIDLAMSEFGGMTMKSEFQNLAALSTFHWGIKGLRALAQSTIELESYRSINNVTRILSYVSSKGLSELTYAKTQAQCIKLLNLQSEIYKSDEWVSTAKDLLIEIVKSVEKDDAFPIGITNNFLYGYYQPAQEHIFAALLARWFNFNGGGIQSYWELIKSEAAEIEYQNFLKSNPNLLEPFHAQIWSKPRFGEDLVPDFLIRSMDNTYTVVEIETPEQPIITKNGELSSYATHAKRQALDFRDWAINNRLYAMQKYPEIYRPIGLVVIGREDKLTPTQAQRLKQENESTQGIVKIVGFDWIYQRAKSTYDNLIKFGFDRETFKETIEE